MDLRVGDSIPSAADSVTIAEFRGGGSFGHVFRATTSAGGNVAVKTIVTGQLDATALNALINEGNLLTRVRDANVVGVIYFHDGRAHPHLPPYIVMEYAADGTLADVIRDRSKEKKPFSNDELQAMFLQLARGMKAINAVVVHRDLKPDNILMSDGALRISDFGLSKLAAVATRSATFKGINHVQYCAPEAWILDANTPAMDMYSMGVVFYEIACLRHPLVPKAVGDPIDAWRQAHLSIVPDDPRRFNPALLPRLTQVILRMLAKRPEDRYRSWDEVITALQADGGSGATAPNVAGLVERALREKQRMEAGRLEREAEAAATREREAVIAVGFRTIREAAADLVRSFNAASETAKLELSPGDGLTFAVSRPSTRLAVQAVVEVLYENVDVSGKRVLAWGCVRAPSRRGFNILLLRSGKDDIYGSWRTIHATHSPLVRPEDNRPEPFYFELSELPRQTQLLNALGLYQMQVGDFHRDQLVPLLEELFD